MKKLMLMGMMAVGMTSFASLQENNNRLEEFTVEYQEVQRVDMSSREIAEELTPTNVREFFRTNLNNYEG